MFNDLKTGLTEAIDLERQVSELQDVVASLQAQAEILRNELCNIILEGEDTVIGRQITISRIKESLNYDGWLKEDNDEEK